MIRNLKTKLWLNMPIDFHGICNIYPLTVEDVLNYMDIPDTSQDQMPFNALFAPYILNDLFLKEYCPEFKGDVWDYLFANVAQVARLVYTLAVFTKDTKIRPDLENQRIMFENGKSLGREHYDELSDIILQAHFMKKFKPEKKKPVKVKNPTYQKRLQRYQAMRQKNPQLDDDIDLAVCVKYIQIASQSYISDKDILSWSYWKLVKWHSDMIRQIEYQNGFICYAQSGDKKLNKSLTKLQTELRTKI